MTSTVKRGEKWVNESAKTARKNLTLWYLQEKEAAIEAARLKMISEHGKSFWPWRKKLDTSEATVRAYMYDTYDWSIRVLMRTVTEDGNVLYRLAASTDCLVEDNYCMLSLEDSAILEKWLNWVPE